MEKGIGRLNPQPGCGIMNKSCVHFYECVNIFIHEFTEESQWNCDKCNSFDSGFLSFVVNSSAAKQAFVS